MPESTSATSDTVPPLAYRWIRAQGLKSLIPWHFFDQPGDAIARDWRERYKKTAGKDAWPFAYRQDRGEIAAFPIRCGRMSGRVVVFDDDRHEAAVLEHTGPPARLERFRSFKDWISSALSESLHDWLSEEHLTDILEN